MGEDRTRMETLVDAIRALTPGQRRRLLRHLRLAGLLEPEEELTDQDRLQVAPALSPRALQGLQSARRPPSSSPSKGTPPPATDAYRSPVRGRVVVGAPGEQEAPTPSMMPPLPGQAPEQPIRIVFDGGSRGNPGQGYGSYALEWPGYPRQVVQLQFGEQVTNNEAEYDTLIAALEAVLKRLQENKADPASARLEVWGDSQLVINQILGEWKCDEPRLQVRRDRARALLARFGDVRLQHHGREHSVAILGH